MRCYFFVELYLVAEVALHVALEVCDPGLLEVVHLGHGCVGDDVRPALYVLNLRRGEAARILVDLRTRGLHNYIYSRFKRLDHFRI